MIRPFTCVCMLLAASSGLYLYQTKHRTRMLDKTIEQTLAATEVVRERTRLLGAEWALLNDPGRLGDLANRFLTLKPVAPGQFVTVADLDRRLPATRTYPAAGTLPPPRPSEIPMAQAAPAPAAPAPEAILPRPGEKQVAQAGTAMPRVAAAVPAPAAASSGHAAPIQPSLAQPSLAQPSLAQPSPAQPSALTVAAAVPAALPPHPAAATHAVTPPAVAAPVLSAVQKPAPHAPMPAAAPPAVVASAEPEPTATLPVARPAHPAARLQASVADHHDAVPAERREPVVASAPVTRPSISALAGPMATPVANPVMLSPVVSRVMATTARPQPRNDGYTQTAATDTAARPRFSAYAPGMASALGNARSLLAPPVPVAAEATPMSGAR